MNIKYNIIFFSDGEWIPEYVGTFGIIIKFWSIEY